MDMYGEWKEDVKKLLEETCIADGFPINDANLLETLIESPDVYSEIGNGHRWWNDKLMVVKVKDSFLGYMWAENTGDDSLSDAGWEFNRSSVDFYEPYVVSVTKYTKVTK